MSTKLKIILGTLLVVAVFLVVRVGSSFYRSAKTAALISQTITTPAPEENFLTKDSDGDGLSDRDEIIYATDMFNKDTDGDGYLDGEEITTGYDPLDGDSSPKTGKKTTGLLASSANLTNRLLDLSVASMIDDSGIIDPTQLTYSRLADIMQSINNEATVAMIIPPPTDADIKIIDDNSPAAITKYLNSATNIIEEGLFSQSSGMLQVFNPSGGISSEYPTYYQNVYGSLKMLEAPSSWKEMHKTTLTVFSQLSNSFKNMTNVQEDPIRASLALNQIQSSFLALLDILNSASRLAKQQNIPVDSILQMTGMANDFLPSQK